MGMIEINPRFHSLIPPLSPEELAGLEALLLRDGCRDPLVTWNGVLVDGHNRFEICQRHALEFKAVAMEFADEDAAAVWIIRNQFGRRNLSLYVRAELGLKLEALLRPAIEAKAKEQQKEHGGAGPGKKSLAQNSAQVNPETSCRCGGNMWEVIGKKRKCRSCGIVICQRGPQTRVELAKAAGVSHDTMAKVRVIEAKASEETKAALRSGDTSINAEWKKLTVHVGQNSGENEWYTPPAFIEAARKAMGSITCDPASSAAANKMVRADVFFTKEQDGLNEKWSGKVWLNPPYAQPLVAQFSEAVCAKLEAGEIKQAIVLVNNATETAWFQRMLAVAVAVCFVKGRVKFLDPQGNPGAPLQGQAVLCLGGDAFRFHKAFAEFGPVLFHAAGIWGDMEEGL